LVEQIASCFSFSFFFHCAVPPRALHSFPTRRSSDLDGLARLERRSRQFEVIRHFHCHRDDVDGRAVDELLVIVERGSDIEELARSEEHTSELQSPYDLVCRLLLEKKKNKRKPKKHCK